MADPLLDRAIEALRPFATMASSYDLKWRGFKFADSVALTNSMGPGDPRSTRPATIGDLRRAREIVREFDEHG